MLVGPKKGSRNPYLEMILALTKMACHRVWTLLQTVPTVRKKSFSYLTHTVASQASPKHLIEKRKLLPEYGSKLLPGLFEANTDQGRCTLVVFLQFTGSRIELAFIRRW